MRPWATRRDGPTLYSHSMVAGARCPSTTSGRRPRRSGLQHGRFAGQNGGFDGTNQAGPWPTPVQVGQNGLVDQSRRRCTRRLGRGLAAGRLNPPAHCEGGDAPLADGQASVWSSGCVSTCCNGSAATATFGDEECWAINELSLDQVMHLAEETVVTTTLDGDEKRCRVEVRAMVRSEHVRPRGIDIFEARYSNRCSARPQPNPESVRSFRRPVAWLSGPYPRGQPPFRL